MGQKLTVESITFKKEGKYITLDYDLMTSFLNPSNNTDLISFNIKIDDKIYEGRIEDEFIIFEDLNETKAIIDSYKIEEYAWIYPIKGTEIDLEKDKILVLAQNKVDLQEYTFKIINDTKTEE